MTPEECTASPKGVFATTSGSLVILLTNSPFDQDFLSHPFIPEEYVHTYMLKGDLGEGMRGETGALSPLRCSRETYPESADCSPECYLPFLVSFVESLVQTCTWKFLHFKMSRGEWLQVGISLEDWQPSVRPRTEQGNLKSLYLFSPWEEWGQGRSSGTRPALHFSSVSLSGAAGAGEPGSSLWSIGKG